METLIHHFGLAAVIAVGLAAIAVGARRKLLLKAAAFAVAALFIPVAYASMVGLLGAPKPLHLEWRHDGIEEATVLGASIREDQGIYLWLQFDGDPEPQSYKLPWNRDRALELQGALREAEENQGQVRMESPFETTTETDGPTFHAPPQPAPPPKREGGAPAAAT